jgi:hypothetical protein
MPTTCPLDGHPAQDWLASHTQYDDGRLDGFVKSGSGPVSIGYWQQADLPFYYSLARQFSIADRYFRSVLGQTYPNRRYLLAATSIGQVNDTTPALTDYPANGTIFDRLDAHDISWKDYFTNLATTELFPPLLRVPGAGRGRVRVGPPAVRFPPGLRPRQHPQAGGDQVEPARADRRRSPAAHADRRHRFPFPRQRTGSAVTHPVPPSPAAVKTPRRRPPRSRARATAT